MGVRENDAIRETKSLLAFQTEQLKEMRWDLLELKKVMRAIKESVTRKYTKKE